MPIAFSIGSYYSLNKCCSFELSINQTLITTRKCKSAYYSNVLYGSVSAACSDTHLRLVRYESHIDFLQGFDDLGNLRPPDLSKKPIRTSCAIYNIINTQIQSRQP